MAEGKAKVMDPLPNWNDGEAKRRIMDAVQSMTDDTSGSFVPPEHRIAAFDNDGTLWCENPMYIQAAFLLERWKELVKDDPSRRNVKSYMAAIEDNADYSSGLRYARFDEIIEGVSEVYQDITPEAFEDAVCRFFESECHPRFRMPYTELTYRPMRELLDLLREHGFKVFIVSAMERDFMRVISEAIYAVPREYVIGTSIVLEYRGGELLRQPALVHPYNDGPGKAIHIYGGIGRPPVFAAGNADGDIQMLEMAQARQRTTRYSGLGVLLHHDDAEREYAYEQSAEKALEAAKRNEWVVVSMKNDFARVF